MNRQDYSGMFTAYLQMYESTKQQNAGKMGNYGREASGAHRTVGGGGSGFHGKAAGMGKDKSTKNDTKADDKRANKQKDQAKADRRAAAMDRRNDGTASQTKLDKVLKDVRNESYHDQFQQYINDNYNDLYNQYLHMINS